MFNKELKKIAEGFLPPNQYGPVIPFNGGLIILNELASDESEQMIYSYFKYRLDTISKDSFSSIYKTRKSTRGLKTTTIPHYLENISNNSEIKNYILIPWNNTCPACRNSFIRYLQKNQYLLKKPKVSIIILARNKEKFRFILEKYDLKPHEGRNIFADVTAKYKLVMPEWVNLKFIQLDERGSVTKNEQFGPGDLKQLQKKLK